MDRSFMNAVGSMPPKIKSGSIFSAGKHRIFGQHWVSPHLFFSHRHLRRIYMAKQVRRPLRFDTL